MRLGHPRASTGILARRAASGLFLLLVGCDGHRPAGEASPAGDDTTEADDDVSSAEPEDDAFPVGCPGEVRLRQWGGYDYAGVNYCPDGGLFLVEDVPCNLGPGGRGCSTDEDCAMDAVCICSFRIPLGERGAELETSRCFSAECGDNQACGDDVCGITFDECGNWLFGAYCHGSADDCRYDSDCADICMWSSWSGHDRWECGYQIDDCW